MTISKIYLDLYFNPMLQGEMNNHLDYESNDKDTKKQTIEETVIQRKLYKHLKMKLK